MSVPSSDVSHLPPMTPLLEARDISKHYGHIAALKAAKFRIYPGEVVALLGDNGAGKSTLIKILAGVIQPSDGQILFEGQPVTMASPIEARTLGIETVYQDLALAPELDSIANTFLGREIVAPGLLGRLGVLDKKAMRLETRKAFERLGVGIRDLTVPIMQLSGGQRQGVAVARAVLWAKKLVILDEPTAALGVVQAANVESMIRRARDQGVAIILITHNMPFALSVADRMEVLRLGTRVARFAKNEATMEMIVGAMTGALEQDDAR